MDRVALRQFVIICCLLLSLLLGACQSPAPTDTAPEPVAAGSLPKVLAIESFLADIAQNVAGDRLIIDTLMPPGIDPHAYEPAPRDLARVADADVLIANGAGFEEWLAEMLDNAGGEQVVIEASAGILSRQPPAGETAALAEDEHDHAIDPHFWLDPSQAVHYVTTIRDGLVTIDPAGEALYNANAAAYSAELNDLDAWISAEIEQIPPERRLLVTNHESLGYFADRYGLRIVGTITPGSSSSAAPSAQQLAQLVDLIRSSGAPAVFLETGASNQLAEQLHAETGITVVTTLYTHSLTAADGPAPTYIDMMRTNTRSIVDALR